MSGSPNPGDIFDVKRIRRLVELMNEHDLSEIDLRQGDQRIGSARAHEPVVTSGPVRTVGAGSAAPSATAARDPPLHRRPTTPSLAIIKSPMVGTFYAAPNPEAAAVRQGRRPRRSRRRPSASSRR